MSCWPLLFSPPLEVTVTHCWMTVNQIPGSFAVQGAGDRLKQRQKQCQGSCQKVVPCLNATVACERMLRVLRANFTSCRCPVPASFPSCALPGQWATWQQPDTHHVSAPGSVAFLLWSLGAVWLLSRTPLKKDAIFPDAHSLWWA